MPTSEDSSNCVGAAENDDNKFASLAVKVEPTEQDNNNCTSTTGNDTPSSGVKTESENLAHEAESEGLKIKDLNPDGEKAAQFSGRQQPAAEPVVNDATKTGGVESVHPSSTATASVLLQSDLIPSTATAEQVCSKTDDDSSIDNDACSNAVATASVDSSQQIGDCNTDNTASNTAPETGCQAVSCEKSRSNSTTSSASEHDNQVESTTELTVMSHSKCSSPQKSKKLVSKHGNTTPPGSPGL